MPKDLLHLRRPLIALTLFIVSAATGYFIGPHLSSRDLPLPDGISQPDFNSAEAYLLDTPDLAPLNLLIAGYGGPGHQGGSLSDTIIVAHLDPQQQVLTFISIPRDLYINRSGVQGKINQAYARSPQIGKDIAGYITGLPIDYFLGIDFVGFQRAIHHIGGITVEVKQAVNDAWYPIIGEELNPCGHTPEEIAHLTATLSGFELEKQFPCRYEHLQVPPGQIFMEGGDALKFVRSRHGSNDFSRGLRAQAVLVGIINRLLELNTLNDIPGFFAQITAYVETDIDSDILTHLIPAIKSIPQLQLVHIGLSTDNVLAPGTGASLVPKTGNWSDIHTYINSQLSPSTTD